MMYVLGMSHAINVLKAAAAGEFALTHENWSALQSGERFFPLPVKPGLVEGDSLQAFIVSHATNWGSVAGIQPKADGGKHVVAVDGYVRLLESIANAGAADVIFSFMHGNEHSMLSLVQHARPCDFHLPWETQSTLVEKAQPLPFDVVRRQMEQALNPALACLAMMRGKLPGVRIVHVMAPPPIESEAHIRQAPEVFREKIEKTGVTPLSVRLKYYRLAERMLAESLAALDVTLLAAPDQARSPSGAIRDDYAYGATHGNEAYGRLVLDQMRALAA